MSCGDLLDNQQSNGKCVQLYRYHFSQGKMINFSIKELNAFAVIGQEVELTNYQKKNIQISTQFWRKFSFKLYVKGILGESYLAYFRKKRMEKAAEFLESTNLKVIEVANSVGYENQGKFAHLFAETYGVSPLEFRRLSK